MLDRGRHLITSHCAAENWDGHFQQFSDVARTTGTRKGWKEAALQRPCFCLILGCRKLHDIMVTLDPTDTQKLSQDTLKSLFYITQDNTKTFLEEKTVSLRKTGKISPSFTCDLAVTRFRLLHLRLTNARLISNAWLLTYNIFTEPAALLI